MTPPTESPPTDPKDPSTTTTPTMPPTSHGDPIVVAIRHDDCGTTGARFIGLHEDAPEPVAFGPVVYAYECTGCGDRFATVHTFREGVLYPPGFRYAPGPASD